MNSLSELEVKEMLIYRISVYDLLRRLFLWEYSLELFKELISWAKTGQSGEVHESWAETELRKSLLTISTEEIQNSYNEIKIEYTRLFVGPYHLDTPPYRSVYRSSNKLMMQDETLSVRSFYMENGYKINDSCKEPDDQVGIELEFMYLMSKKALDAFQEQSSEKLINLLSVQKEFMDNHLFKWLPEFCQDILKSSRNQFWKNISQFTKKFIEEDKGEIGQIQGMMKESI